MGFLERIARRLAGPILRLAVPLAIISSIFLILFYWSILKPSISRNKDEISSLSSIVSMIGFIYLISISYVKLFGGRLYVPKAKIEIFSSVGRISDSINLHLIRIVITNTGIIPFRFGSVTVSVRDYDEINRENYFYFEPTKCIIDNLPPDLDQIIDSGQNSVYYFTRKVNQHTKISTYEAIVKDFLGNIWTDIFLIENK